MAEFVFNNIDDKFIGFMKVDVAAWSPSMDLIATGSAKGDVGLYRLKMVTAWESSNPGLGAVTQLAWRPDGKMLAVAYSTGWLHFCLLEDGFVFHRRQLDTTVSHLDWVAAPEELTGSFSEWTDAPHFIPNVGQMPSYKDFTDHENVVKIINVSKEMERKFSVLVVTSGFSIHLFGNGFYHIAGFNLDSEEYRSSEDDKLIRATLSVDFKTLSFVIKRYDHEGRTVFREHRIDVSVMRHSLPELRNISMQNVALLTCKQLMNSCLDQIKQSWEDTLLELDMKLTRYARSRAETDENWSLRNELLELLLFGHCRYQLRTFLIDEWTAAGLKRLGVTIANTYESIHKICHKQIEVLLQWVLLHATEVLGMVRVEERYGALGISEDNVRQLIRDAGAALQKTQEVQLVIDKATKHLKAFFRWLYASILELSDEKLSADLLKSSSSEQRLVVDFITDQLKPTIVGGKIESYHIELVEQYMIAGDLKKPFESVFNNDLHSEMRFVVNRAKYDCENSNPDGIFQFFTNTSLVDVMHDHLYKNMAQTFNLNWGEFTNKHIQIHNSSFITLLQMGDLEDVSLSLMTTCEEGDESEGKTTYFWTAFILPSRDTLAVVKETGGTNQRFALLIELNHIPRDDSKETGGYTIEDTKFFSPQVVTMIVSKQTSPNSPSTFNGLIFLSMDRLADYFTPLTSSEDSCVYPNPHITKVNCSDFLSEANVERLPRRATHLEVNGVRNIVFVLFDSEQQCRTYILETPDELSEAMETTTE